MESQVLKEMKKYILIEKGVNRNDVENSFQRKNRLLLIGKI